MQVDAKVLSTNEHRITSAGAKQARSRTRPLGSQLEKLPRALGIPLYQLFYIAKKRPSYRILPSARVSYGKTEQLIRYDGGKPRHLCRRKPREQRLALIPDAHEGYVSWEEFERITAAIRANTQGNSSLAQ
jgi:hypothetical protein